MANNFYNPSNPWIYNGNGGTANASAGQMNQSNLQAQTPGYSGFNNFQRPTVPATIPGRLVANADEITPQEVPMDGSVSLFPQNDFACIYAKTWTKEGTIATMRFVPEQPQGAVERKSPLEERLDRIDQQLETISKRLNRSKSNYQKRNNPYPKKKEGEE